MCKDAIFVRRLKERATNHIRTIFIYSEESELAEEKGKCKHNF